jgi:hypothetical protein
MRPASADCPPASLGAVHVVVTRCSSEAKLEEPTRRETTLARQFLFQVVQLLTPTLLPHFRAA